MSLIKRLIPPTGLGVGVLTLALLSGCATKPPPVKGARADPPTALDQYQVKSREAPDQVGLSIHAEGLSPAQRDALAAFASRWRDAGSGTITLQRSEEHTSE